MGDLVAHCPPLAVGFTSAPLHPVVVLAGEVREASSAEKASPLTAASEPCVEEARSPKHHDDLVPQCPPTGVGFTSAPLRPVVVLAGKVSEASSAEYASPPTIASEPCVEDAPTPGHLDADLEPRCPPAAVGFVSAPLCPQRQVK